LSSLVIMCASTAMILLVHHCWGHRVPCSVKMYSTVRTSSYIDARRLGEGENIAIRGGLLQVMLLKFNAESNSSNCFTDQHLGIASNPGFSSLEPWCLTLTSQGFRHPTSCARTSQGWSGSRSELKIVLRWRFRFQKVSRDGGLNSDQRVKVYAIWGTRQAEKKQYEILRLVNSLKLKNYW
jgi:hypothetical protein